jgi:hypothetical protein
MLELLKTNSKSSKAFVMSLCHVIPRVDPVPIRLRVLVDLPVIHMKVLVRQKEG